MPSLNGCLRVGAPLLVKMVCGFVQGDLSGVQALGCVGSVNSELKLEHPSLTFPTF